MSKKITVIVPDDVARMINKERTKNPNNTISQTEAMISLIKKGAKSK